MSEAVRERGAEPAAGTAPVPRDVHPIWYVVALAVYVGLSLASLSLRDNVLLLNWIIGPLFLVVLLYVIPTGVRALVRRRSRT